jgi:hypothetical protein
LEATAKFRQVVWGSANRCLTTRDGEVCYRYYQVS